MANGKRKLQILFLVAVSMTILAAPARGAEWFGFHLGPGGFSLSFGASNWAVYGSSWSHPGWAVDYHAALAGYGEWVWVDGLGQCWRPLVAVGWRPYTHGRWVWTRLGWTWIAYEPWGYFPHHFGHWALTGYGWVWRPGYQYRAANVVWVGAGGYVGWYPCAPPGWSHARRGWHRGYERGYAHGFDAGYWAGWHDAQYATYTRWQHFGSDDVSRHAVLHSGIGRDGTPSVLRAGLPAPDRSDLHRRGIRPPTMELDSRNLKVGDRQVTISRPRGAGAEVRRHTEPTVRRALSADAQRTAVDRERRARSVSPASSTTTVRSRPSSANPGRTHGVTSPGRRPDSSPSQVRRADARTSAPRQTAARPSEPPAISRRSDSGHDRTSTRAPGARDGQPTAPFARATERSHRPSATSRSHERRSRATDRESRAETPSSNQKADTEHRATRSKQSAEPRHRDERRRSPEAVEIEKSNVKSRTSKVDDRTSREARRRH